MDPAGTSVSVLSEAGGVGVGFVGVVGASGVVGD